MECCHKGAPWEWPHLAPLSELNPELERPGNVIPAFKADTWPGLPLGMCPENLFKGGYLLHPFLKVRAGVSTSHQCRDPELQK